MPNKLTLVLRGIKETGLRPTWDAVSYHVRKRWYESRFGRYRLPEPEDAVDWIRPGPVVRHAVRGRTLAVDCAQGTYLLTVLTPAMVRVRVVPASQTDWEDVDQDALEAPPSYAVVKPDDAWPPCQVDVEETGSALELKTADLICRVEKDSGRLTFLDAEGRVINEDAAGAGWLPGDGDGPGSPVICQKRIQPDEHFYGLGERTCGLDLRGRRFATWNSDPQSYELGQDPVYLCIPFLLGLHSGGEQGYGIFFDNTFRGRFDLGAAEGDAASFAAVGGELTYVFIYGPGLRSVVERYTNLTGRMALPPLWALGYHQSRWSYYPEERVRELAAQFRDTYDVPCDAIHLDIHYMEGYRCLTWDRECFPDPAGLAAELHERGFKLITILDAGIKADPDYWVCQSGLVDDVFCKLPNGRLIKAPVWPGDSYFPDFTSQRVRAWWGDLLRSLTEMGVDGIWNDMNEPAVFGPEGTTLPDAVRHDLDGRGGDHAEAHNVYGMQMARATAEGLGRLRPHLRPFTITRSGWAGVQRYAAGWTADNRATWDQLWLTMPMVLNLGLSGLAFTGPDVGGFLGHPSAELFTRWLQMSVFLPFFRSHTYLHDPDQEPWSWGEPTLSINRRWIEHRYRLLPYLYTAFWQCAQTGVPMVRPLLLAFQDDPETHALDDAFLCGEHLLVAPIREEGAVRRTVYLPEGVWYDVWTDERLTGPAHVEVEAPLERIPVFARAGSVVPTADPVRYVGERPQDRLVLHVYPPEVDVRDEDEARTAALHEAVSVLYEDDGASYDYRRGVYRLSRFQLTVEGEERRELDLRRETEGGYEPGYESFDVVIHGVEGRPSRATCDGEDVGPGEMDEDRPALRLRLDAFEHLTLEWGE